MPFRHIGEPFRKAAHPIGVSGGTGDTTAPTVTITSAESIITSGAFDIAITASEDTADLVVGGLTVTNGSAGSFSGSGAAYTATITPTTAGTVTVKINAGAFHDGAGNANEASNTFSIVSLTGGVCIVRADKITGLNNDDAVTTWADLSGNNNSPTQGGAAGYKPTYKTNILNTTLPVVRGDGGDTLQKAFTLNQPCTIFCVFKILTEGDNKTIFDGSTINKAKFSELTASTDTFRLFSGAGLTLVHPAVDSFVIATAKINGASSRISIGSASASGDAGSNNPGGVTLFSNGNGFGAEGSNSDIFCWFAFAGAMADATMNEIGTALSTLTGLTWVNF